MSRYTGSRRSFLARLGAACAAAALQPTLSAYAAASPRPVGIQLWTVNAFLKRDPAGTLQRLRAIGYQEVESIPIEGVSAASYAQYLRQAGLQCPSAHLEFKLDQLDAAFEAAHILGVEYVVSSLLRPGTGELPYAGAPRPEFIAPMAAMTLDDARRTAEIANRIGEAASRAGLKYCYHNHYFEFVDQGGGATGYDLLLQQTDPRHVQFELDCGWMSVAGRDPVSYLRRYPTRIPMLHIKEFLAPDADTGAGARGALRRGSELGAGAIDYRPIFKAALAAQVRHFYAEQEGPYSRMDPMQAAAADYRYLRQQLS